MKFYLVSSIFIQKNNQNDFFFRFSAPSSTVARTGMNSKGKIEFEINMIFACL